MRPSANAKPAAVKPSRLKSIQSLLAQIENQFEADPPEATLADCVRLMQLEHELDEEVQPGEIVARWEDPDR